MDTLWLNETFSSGPIQFDPIPEFWNEDDNWYFDVSYGQIPPINYPRIRMLEAVSYPGVIDGQLYSYDPSSMTAWFSVMGGNEQGGYGAFCPRAEAHFISADFTFGPDPESMYGGYFHAVTCTADTWSDLILLEIVGGPGGWLFWFTAYEQPIVPPWVNMIYFDEQSQSKTSAELLAAGKVTIRMEWQYGTEMPDDTVLSDGWAKLWFGTELLYFIENIPLHFKKYQDRDGEPHNTFNGVAIGWNGAPPASYFDNVKAGIPGLPPIWVDIADYVTVELDSAEFIGGVATVRVATWAGTVGMPVQVRLQNVTDDVTVALGETVTSTTPVTQLFTATLSTGVKRYRLQVSVNDYGVDVFAMGQIQVPVVS